MVVNVKITCERFPVVSSRCRQNLKFGGCCFEGVFGWLSGSALFSEWCPMLSPVGLGCLLDG